jgi:thiol-disulfide isomerase/thioredoxin
LAFLKEFGGDIYLTRERPGGSLLRMDRIDKLAKREGENRFSLPRVGVYAAVAVLAAAAGIISALTIFGPEGSRHAAEDSAETGSVIGKLIRHREPKGVPDIVFADASGNPRHLSEWRGKIVLLNLWATWCAPCKTEMPSLDRVQARFGSDRFTVLAVSTDRGGLKEPAAFFASQGITHLALYNDPTAGANIGMKATGLPLTVVLDEDGREVARLLGPADWDSPQAAANIEGFLQRGRAAG